MDKDRSLVRISYSTMIKLTFPICIFWTIIQIMKEGEKFSTIILSFANTFRYKCIRRFTIIFFFFFVLVKNQHSFDFYKIVETNLPLAVSFFVFMIFAANSWPVLFWTHRRTTEKAPLKRREIVKFANRTQDLEERTIKLTKCDTINPLTSSIRNCSPNFVYVCMYVWPPRTTGIYWNIVGDWNFVDYTIDCACAI